MKTKESNPKSIPKSPKTRRAVGYCRTSGDRRDSTSIPRQKEEIANFIQHNDWELVHFYVDKAYLAVRQKTVRHFNR